MQINKNKKKCSYIFPSSGKAERTDKPDIIDQYEHVDKCVFNRILPMKDSLHTFAELFNEVWKFAHRQPKKYQHILALIKKDSEQMMDIIH